MGRVSRKGSMSPGRQTPGAGSPTHSTYNDLNIEVRLSNQSAIKSISELERKVEKLKNLASRGENIQGGVLSKRQVDMYKNILKEMEYIYESHQQRLTVLQQEYEKKRQPQIQELTKRYNQYVDARQRGVSPGVLGFYQSKYEQAKSAVESSRSPELEDAIKALTDKIHQLQNTRDKSSSTQDRINDMHERNSVVEGAVNGLVRTVMRHGIMTNTHQFAHYLDRGAETVRSTEEQGYRIGQKVGYNGSDDSNIRVLGRTTGEINNYNTQDTLRLQETLIRGGYNQDNLGGLNRDTKALQTIGRAYAMDTDELGQGVATLKTFGTLKDGEAQRFANILANAINKGGMRGREEEMTRSAVSLLDRLSKTLPQVTESQMSNVMSLQTALANAIPEYKGTRGAEKLSTIDSAIKSGGNAIDLLMGKGTKYQGIEGIYNLKYQQEEGIANPKNLAEIMQGLDRVVAGGTPISSQLKDFIASENLGISLHDMKAFRKTGLLDRLTSGDYSMSQSELDNLASMGVDPKTLEKLSQWDNTQTKRGKYVDTQDSKLREQMGVGIDRMDKTFGEMFHSIPSQTVKGGLLASSALFSGVLLNKFRTRGIDSLSRLGPSIGQNASGWFRNIFKGTGGTGGAGGVMSGMGSILNPKNIWSNYGKGIGNTIGGFAQYGDDLINAGGWKAFLGKGVSSVAKGAGALGKSIPIVGGAVSLGIDRMSNPETSWGRSIFKTVGGVIGGIGGGAVAGALGVGTGGVGTALAGTGLVAGGSAGGTWAGDKLYDLMFGKSDKVKQSEIDRSKDIDKSKSSNTDKYSMNPSSDNSHVQEIKITVDGKIDGMDTSNQKVVSSAISDYYKQRQRSNRLDLAYEQKWR